MLFSVYPTDAPEVRDAVLAQACALAPTPMIFTSLHLPENADLEGFGAVLADMHRERGITFCADISPLTIERLGTSVNGAGFAGAGIEGVARLRDWGITVLRIDFGFAPDQIRAIAAASQCGIAVNASTATASLLDELEDLRPVGWHNFYPRPETGITPSFYVSQNELFASRNLPVFAFLPGEVSFRAPLHQGVPTLEEHRYRTVWRNYLHLRALDPEVEIVCAEGTLRSEHVEWIAHHEQTGEVSLPLIGVDPAARFLIGMSWRLRTEDAAASFRLEGTRGSETPSAVRNGDRRAAGSLQMDLEGLGRYRGEIQLMRQDLPLTGLQAYVGEIAAPYRGLVEDLRPGDTVRFV